METELSARDVLRQALAIEKQLGRQRKLLAPHSSPLTRKYAVPHPRMHLRRFVLEPLCEVMPDYLHPLLHKTVKQLLTEL